MMRQIRKYFTLPRADRRLLVQAMAMLPMLTLGLRLFGTRGCFVALKRITPMARSVANSETSARHRVARTEWLVRVASMHGPIQGNCLIQSLTIWWLLHRQGIPTELRIGVRKSHGRLEAHAWAEHDDQVVNDDPDIARRYSPFRTARGMFD